MNSVFPMQHPPKEQEKKIRIDDEYSTVKKASSMNPGRNADPLALPTSANTQSESFPPRLDRLDPESKMQPLIP